MSSRLLYLVTGVMAVAAVAAATAAGGRDGFDGVVGSRALYDAAVAVRAAVFGHPDEPAGAPAVAVIAIDHASLESPELSGLPRALMSPVLAEVIDSALAADARVVGLDLLFAFNGNRMRPGHDDELLRVLASSRDRIVIVRSSGRTPVRTVFAAIGGDGQVAYGELDGGRDDVIRRVDARLRDGASLAGALLAKTGIAHRPTALLAPYGHIERVPTYALVDLLRCAEREPNEVRAALGGRIVLVGTTLPEEDRQHAADRWLPDDFRTREGVDARCLRERGAPSLPGSRTRPGVHVHAAAVRALAGAEAATAVPPVVTHGVGVIATVAAVWAGASLAAVAAAAAPALLSIGIFAAMVGALQIGWWIPGGAAMAGTVLGAQLTYLARWLTVDRSRRQLRHAFGHYLSPALIDDMLQRGRSPVLGGEEREISVLFSDLSEFTRASETVDPQTLVRRASAELSAIGEIIEAERGYIDKFIGDGVMVLWNAPVDDAEHAVRAVRSALAISEDNRRRLQDRGSAGRLHFAVRIAVNTGPAILGNIGARRRFNYTAIGDTVNVAARLESLPKLYGCSIVLGEETGRQTQNVFLLRELDRVRLRGRAKPLTIFEPVCPWSEATEKQSRQVEDYGRALTLYRSRQFGEAAAAFERIVAANPSDGPARTFAGRCRALVVDPPSAHWDAVHDVSRQ